MRFLIFLFLGLNAHSASLDDWITKQRQHSIEKLNANLVLKDSLAGSVAASPSRANPDYAWHWVRDAAVVMDWYAKEFARTHDDKIKSKLFDYARFSELNQNTKTLTGLGEPRFTLQSQADFGEWGRPQDDGPALRALTLSRFVNTLLDLGHDKSLVTQLLYDSKLPSQSVIKRDLEYVAARILNDSFDLWEEVKGFHFYTRMVQHRALREGAALARRLGDFQAADWYDSRAGILASLIGNHLDSGRGILLATLNQTGGMNGKISNLDSSVVLASLHAMGDRTTYLGLFPAYDPWISKTVLEFESRFKSLYAINTKSLAAWHGRYPEDRYYGGNPWILTTLAVAEMHYKSAIRERNLNRLDAGDKILAMIQSHFANQVSDFAEQIDRNSGAQISAADLSWSYVAFLTAIEARHQAIRVLARAPAKVQ